jgi:hypothetical protein
MWHNGQFALLCPAEWWIDRTNGTGWTDWRIFFGYLRGAYGPMVFHQSYHLSRMDRLDESHQCTDYLHRCMEVPLPPAVSRIGPSVTVGSMGRIAPMDGFSWVSYPNYHMLSTRNILYHNRTVPFTKFTDGTHGVDSTVLDNPRIVRNYSECRRYLPNNTYKNAEILVRRIQTSVIYLGNYPTSPAIDILQLCTNLVNWLISKQIWI